MTMNYSDELMNNQQYSATILKIQPNRFALGLMTIEEINCTTDQ